MVVASVLRNHPRSVDPSIKSNNLLNNVLAMQEAIRQGAYEAILLNHRGELAECSQSNLFAVRHGVVLTPPLDAGLLEGVTRNFLFEVGADIGVPVREAVLRQVDLEQVDELFHHQHHPRGDSGRACRRTAGRVWTPWTDRVAPADPFPRPGQYPDPYAGGGLTETGRDRTAACKGIRDRGWRRTPHPAPDSDGSWRSPLASPVS